MRVTSTGAFRRLERAMTSSEALIAPPPTRIRGRLACLIHRTACSRSLRSSLQGLMKYSSSRRDGSIEEFI